MQSRYRPTWLVGALCNSGTNPFTPIPKRARLGPNPYGRGGITLAPELLPGGPYAIFENPYRLRSRGVLVAFAGLRRFDPAGGARQQTDHLEQTDDIGKACQCDDNPYIG